MATRRKWWVERAIVLSGTRFLKRYIQPLESEYGGASEILRAQHEQFRTKNSHLIKEFRKLIAGNTNYCLMEIHNTDRTLVPPECDSKSAGGSFSFLVDLDTEAIVWESVAFWVV